MSPANTFEFSEGILYVRFRLMSIYIKPYSPVTSSRDYLVAAAMLKSLLRPDPRLRRQRMSPLEHFTTLTRRFQESRTFFLLFSHLRRPPDVTGGAAAQLGSTFHRVDPVVVSFCFDPPFSFFDRNSRSRNLFSTGQL